MFNSPKKKAETQTKMNKMKIIKEKENLQTKSLLLTFITID